ncbi:MAG: beta-propeller domain-containing protein, partial [Clostridia bacterium]|nr:beta-propeller domain-containing protein [Clostridia bacterium]
MMFDKNYKRAMENIVPSDDAVTKTFDSMRKANSEKKSITKNRFKIIAVACLAVVIVTTSVFAAFKFSGVSEPTEFNGIRKASSYDDIDSLVKQSYSNNTYGIEGGGINSKDWFIGTDDAVVEATPEMDSTAIDTNTKFDTARNDKDFSDTNNQVSGVQEADIVKTDGKYIYYVTSETKKLFISEINNSEMKQLSSLTIDTGYIHEMLLINDTLCLISDGISKSSATECRYYNISDRNNPVLEHTLTQDGSYISSRAIDTEVYVISNFSKIEKGLLNTRTAVIPEINDEKIDADCIWIPEKIQNTRFTIVTAYNANKGNGDFDSAVSVIGASDTLYSGKENLYLTNVINGLQYAESGTKVPNSKTDIYR